MKKIYIFAAVLALLTLSLNAQDGVKVIDNATIIEKAPKLTATANNQSKSLTATIKAGNFSFYEMLSGIKGMSSVLQAGQDHTTYSANGQSRAPLRLNSDEVTVGPFEGDNFSTNGLGFPTAYGDNPQQIYITTELDRNEFIDHNGDEIVGFRFALAGNSSQKAVLYDFIAWPHSNGYFSQDRYTWTISEFNETPDVSTTFDDIVITVPGNSVVFSEITVYDQDNNVLTTWNANSTDTYTVTTSSGGTATAYNLPTGWTLQNVYMFRWSYNGNYYGYLSTSSQSSITIDASYLTGCTSAHVVIGAMGDYGTETLDVNGDTRNVTTEIVSYNFNLSPTGGGTPIYVELEGGQWHEFYLDEPIPFNVADSIIGMRMGYGYYQYPSTETSELLYPIAVNPNSTSHNHISYMVKQNGTTTGSQLLTGWNYATDARNFPSTWTVPSSMGSGSISGSLYFGSSSGADIVIPASDLQGLTDVTVKVTAGKENTSTHTLTVNGTATSSALTTSLLEYTWDNVNASSGITIHVSDWYVDISKIEVYGMLTVPNYQQGWWIEDFSTYGDLAVQLIFKNTTNPTIDITPENQTISDAAAGTLTVTGTDIEGNINVSAGNDWSLNPTSLGNTGGDVNVTYTGRALSASTTVTATAANDNTVTATATVDYVADLYIVGDYGSGWNFSDNSNHMTYNNGTYTATITVNANAYILFARLLGNDNPWNTRDVFGPVSEGNWGMVGDNAVGNIDLYDDDPIYFPEGGTYRITINPDGTFTITKLNGEQTAPPVITSSSDGEYVTITATGDGTVTLNVPGYDPVSGEGEVSITIPCGYASNTITVSATAQEPGKDESDPATAQITIPAGSDWVEMDGEYNNPNNLLSFLKDGEDIMLIDQFVADTKNNSHPDHYTYTLRQTVNGETQTSTPVSIPVYKTSSTMQGLYTQNQVTGDTDMKLKPNVVNTEMDFDVNPDRNVLYYSLYRGEKNAYYPEITADSRISQLQKFEEMVNGQVQYFMFENHQEGIAPRYDHVGNQIVERLDTNWVEAAYNDNVAYVPVIWTFGLYTARGDGKNNSYGSDIKREYMGKVTANITGQISQGDNGTWEDNNGTTYRAFHPTIVATGYLPQNGAITYNDEDQATYVPFLCRAWCTNEGIHDYGRDADGHLEDRGELPTPFLLGEATFGSDMTATIGGDWTQGSVRDPWSFGLPASVTESQVTFKIRFYYKKVVTEGQQNGGNGKFIGGAAEEFFMAETEGDANDMIVGINEFMNGIVPVSVTYVNPQGMQSSRPFDGVNIVVTRYSDGTTRTSKVIR